MSLAKNPCTRRGFESPHRSYAAFTLRVPVLVILFEPGVEVRRGSMLHARQERVYRLGIPLRFIRGDPGWYHPTGINSLLEKGAGCVGIAPVTQGDIDDLPCLSIAR